MSGRPRRYLSRSAKSLLIVFITLGLISVGCQVWSVDLLTSQFGRIIAIGRWDVANNELTASINGWQTATQACNQNVVACLARADGQAALAVSVFASQIQAISMPTAAVPDAARVRHRQPAVEPLADYVVARLRSRPRRSANATKPKIAAAVAS